MIENSVIEAASHRTFGRIRHGAQTSLFEARLDSTKGVPVGFLCWEKETEVSHVLAIAFSITNIDYICL